MNSEMYQKLLELSMEPETQEKTIQYLAEHLGNFLKPGERVMLAFRDQAPGTICWLMEQAALRVKVVPVLWGSDRRWNTLLRQTFNSRASAVIGSPVVILGLMKLKKQFKTPLPIRKAITMGYPCPYWLYDGIVKGLDCEVGGCFSIGESGIVAGFACGHSWGVHLREDVYGVDIVDPQDNILPADQMGQMVLYPKADPSVRFYMGDKARKIITTCDCGSSTMRLMDMIPGTTVDPELYALGQDLQSWTSILDCRVSRSPSGLEIEIVCFPGEKLPKLPTAAKLVIRPYNPKEDEPFFWYVPR
jgi:hypothetical protein